MRSSESTSTMLQADELSALCGFMTASIEETAPRALISRALNLIHRQTWAIDDGLSQPRSREPLAANRGARSSQCGCGSEPATDAGGQEAWPTGLARPAAAGGRGAERQSGSVSRCRLCPAAGFRHGPGRVHVYKDQRRFTEREVQFIEVLAGYLAKSLYVLRGRQNLAAENVRLRGRENRPPGRR